MLAEHPTEDALTSYGLGKLDDATAAQIDRHLESCEGCRRRVAEATGDSFVNRLQGAAAADDLGDFEASRTDVEASQTLPVVAAPDLPAALATATQYTNIRKLGQGGMGVVYLAKNVLMDREEVLKVASDDLLKKPGALARFWGEIKSAASLNHPNVVCAYTAQQVGHTLVFSMEYVSGADLGRVLADKGPLPVGRACHFAYQTALGLQHAHERNMIHRDIKPSNLVLTRVGKKLIVKITDFGLAKSTNPLLAGADDPPDISKRPVTLSGSALGTPAYMAPEQFRDAARVDIRADIYSLGCTLYALLTGGPPFREKTVFALMLAHQQNPPPPLAGVRPDVPQALAAVVAKMLAKDPNDRYQTPAEVAKALVPFFKPVTNPTAGPSIPEGLIETAVLKSTRDESGLSWPVESAPPARRRWPAIAVAALVLAVAGSAAAVVLLKTGDGTIELTDLDPNAEVLVDGERATITWAAGQKTAEVRVKPGTRDVAVTVAGVTVVGQRVEIDQNGRKVLSARVNPPPPPPSPDDATRKLIDGPGYVALFDGKTLVGLKQDEVLKGTWTVGKDGLLYGRGSAGPRTSARPQPAILRTTANYQDFILRVTRDTFREGDQQMSIWLRSRRNEKSNSGYVVGLGGVQRNGKRAPIGTIGLSRNASLDDDDDVEAAEEAKPSAVPFGKPYTLDIVVRGTTISTWVNGQKIQEITNELYSSGQVMFHHARTIEVRYSRIAIKELPAIKKPEKE